MTARTGFALFLLWGAIATTHAESSAGYVLHGESAAAREEGAFALPAGQRPFALHEGVGELYLRHGQNGAVVEWAGDWRVAEGGTAHGQGRLNELYSDFAAGGLDFTAGKKVMSSGIGFGFRPLDVIQREDRRTLFAARLEGVPLLAAERIEADWAASLVYVNRLAVDRHGVTRGVHEAVLRYYRLADPLELHALVHLHERQGAAPGAGFTWVGGEGLELHGAVLYQPRFTRLSRGDAVLAQSDPWQAQEAREDGKALLGLSWTGEAGYSLLLEAWHDGEAWSGAEWRRLRETAAAQRAMLGVAPGTAVYGNLAWDLRAFDRPSLMRDNLLMRLSHDGERWDPYLDLLVTPGDRGYVATAGFTYQLRQGLTLSAGARRVDGPADSAYGLAPIRGVVFVELAGEMVR